jgi:hypothetical protein
VEQTTIGEIDDDELMFLNARGPLSRSPQRLRGGDDYALR